LVLFVVLFRFLFCFFSFFDSIVCLFSAGRRGGAPPPPNKESGEVKEVGEAKEGPLDAQRKFFLR
jgi:hypothetical protein